MAYIVEVFATSWIEISNMSAASMGTHVEVFATSWIEISLKRALSPYDSVEVFATSWIEIYIGVPSAETENCRGLCDLVD